MPGPATPSVMGTTTISIPEDLADELYSRKGRGESYADVIRRLIEQADAGGDSREATETPSEQSRNSPESPSSEDVGGQSGERVAASGNLADLVDDVADDTLPGSGAKLEARREALHAVVAYLREHGSATPAEFRSDVYPDHDGGYTEGQDPARSWWKNAMYPALAELADRTDVLEKADTTGEWAYTGEE